MAYTYTTEQLETISSKLGELPAVEKRKRQHNKKDAIRLLARDIASLRTRGYTLGQIAEILTRESLEITERTLRNYLQQLKRPVKKASARQKLAPQNTDTRGTKNNPESETQTATDTPSNIAKMHQELFGSSDLQTKHN